MCVCIESSSNVEDRSTRSASLNAFSDRYELFQNFIEQRSNFGKFSEKKVDRVLSGVRSVK